MIILQNSSSLKGIIGTELLCIQGRSQQTRIRAKYFCMSNKGIALWVFFIKHKTKQKPQQQQQKIKMANISFLGKIILWAL